MIYWDFLGVLLQIVCGMVGGVCSYLLTNWVQIRLSLGLDYRLSDLEGKVNREVKIRASEASRRNQHWDKELIEKIQMEKPQPNLDLKTWREQKFKVN